MNKKYLLSRIDSAYSDIVNLNTEARNNLVMYCNDYEDMDCFIQMALDYYNPSLRDSTDDEVRRYFYSCEAINYLINAFNKTFDIGEFSFNISSLYNLYYFIDCYLLGDYNAIKINIDDDYQEFNFEAIHVEDNKEEGTQNIKEILDKLDKFVNLSMKKDNVKNIGKTDYSKFINKENIINKINEIYATNISKITEYRNSLLVSVLADKDIAEFVQKVLECFDIDCIDEKGYEYYCHCVVTKYLLDCMNSSIDINEFDDTDSLFIIDEFVNFYLKHGFEAVIKIDDGYEEYPVDALHVEPVDTVHKSVKEVLETLDKLAEIMVKKNKIQNKTEID